MGYTCSSAISYMYSKFFFAVTLIYWKINSSFYLYFVFDHVFFVSWFLFLAGFFLLLISSVLKGVQKMHGSFRLSFVVSFLSNSSILYYLVPWF